MQLAEQHQITENHRYFKEIDKLCFLSKNIYNSTLYNIRQHYFATNKYLGYYTLDKMFKEQKQPDYYSLNTQVAQNTMKWLDANFRGFFNAMKIFKTNPEVFDFNQPKPPKYKDKIKGRNLVVYSNQRLKKPLLKKGIISPHGTNLKITTKINPETINHVRIIPNNNCYVIEIVYTVPEIELKVDNSKIAAIDLGINNLAAIVSTEHNPQLINGRPLKAINHYYNRKLAQLKSKLLKGQYTSNKIKKLALKRNNKIKDYMHKASRKLTNHLASLDISTLIIGKNANWKQEVNLGKRNNQNFVQIPFAKFIQQLTYKCFLKGIKVIEQEESYTSKCSYLDNEIIEKHEIYVGKRIKRGLFRSAEGILLNADINGACNIFRKAISKPEGDGIQGVVVSPVRMKVIRSTIGTN